MRFVDEWSFSYNENTKLKIRNPNLWNIDITSTSHSTLLLSYCYGLDLY